MSQYAPDDRYFATSPHTRPLGDTLPVTMQQPESLADLPGLLVASFFADSGGGAGQQVWPPEDPSPSSSPCGCVQYGALLNLLTYLLTRRTRAWPRARWNKRHTYLLTRRTRAWPRARWNKRQIPAKGCLGGVGCPPVAALGQFLSPRRAKRCLGAIATTDCIAVWHRATTNI